MTSEQNKIKIHPPLEFSNQAHIKNVETFDAFSHTAEVQSDAFWTELSRALIFDKKFEKEVDSILTEAQNYS